MDTFRDLSRFSSRIDFLGRDVVGVNRDRRDVISKSAVSVPFSLCCDLIDFVGLKSIYYRCYHIIIIFCLGSLGILDKAKINI